MRVAHHQQAILADRETTRFALFALGRSPRTDKVPIAIEHLNTTGHVDNVQPVLVINRDRSRLQEPPVVQTSPAPNQDVRVKSHVTRLAATNQ